MAECRVGYFLEDVGQESFVVALVQRIAAEVGLATDELSHDPRNATGGSGSAITELRVFLRDVARGRDRPFDILVVAIDANCERYVEKRNAIQRVVEQAGYPGTVIHAIPDPHIERWYLIDGQSLSEIIETDIQPPIPPYKCERGRYKQILRDVFRGAGIAAPLGGAEYGPEVAAALDIYMVGRADAGFRHFVDQLRAALTPLAQT